MPVIIVIWYSELKAYNEELFFFPFLRCYSIIYISNSKQNENLVDLLLNKSFYRIVNKMYTEI